jgi:hypothetical protein
MTDERSAKENFDVVVHLADSKTRYMYGCVLALASPVFRALLNQPSNEHYVKYLTFHDISDDDWDTFYSFIDIRYSTSRTAIMCEANVHMLVNLFTMFQMEQLRQVTTHLHTCLLTSCYPSWTHRDTRSRHMS